MLPHIHPSTHPFPNGACGVRINRSATAASSSTRQFSVSPYNRLPIGEHVLGPIRDRSATTSKHARPPRPPDVRVRARPPSRPSHSDPNFRPDLRSVPLRQAEFVFSMLPRPHGPILYTHTPSPPFPPVSHSSRAIPNAGEANKPPSPISTPTSVAPSPLTEHSPRSIFLLYNSRMWRLSPLDVTYRSCIMRELTSAAYTHHSRLLCM